MPLSAGDGRVGDVVREFAETGTVACDRCVSTADPETAICQALTDENSPGVIDEGERAVFLNATDAGALLLAAPLVKQPPLLARLSVLREKAETWCLTGRCRSERAEAQAELEALAVSVPDEASAGADPFVVGGAAFAGAVPDGLVQAGIGRQLGFWEWVWFSSPDTMIYATTFAKDHLTAVDLKAGEKAPVKEKGAADPMRGVRGKEKDFREATARYRPWQPYLERAFQEMGFPGVLAAIAIPESEMQSGQKSGVGAGGPYQIMPANTNLPAYDVYRSKSAGIDERENPYLAARAAARIFAEARRTILGRSFVEGVSFSPDLATLMSTSGYHAGAERMRRALVAAKAEFEAARKPVSGEALFAHILSTDREYEKFQAASKDYPVKFLPVVKALYTEKVPSLAPKGGEALPDLALVEIGAFAKKTGVADLARIVGLSKEEFLKLNPQFDGKKTKDEIRLGKGGVPKCRLVLPTAVAQKLCRKLVAEKRVEAKDVASRRILDPVPAVAMRKKKSAPSALARR